MTRKIWAYRKKRTWSHKGAKRGMARARKSRWKVPDKGKRGKTPRSKRWFRQRGDIRLGKGYTGMSTNSRRDKLVRLDRKRNISSRSLWNELQGLANVSTSRKSRAVFRRDADWVMNHRMTKAEKQAMTRSARR